MRLPETFIIRTKKLLGDDWAAFEQALNEESPVSIRLNPRKASLDLLSEYLPLSEPVPWATNGYYLSSRPSFTLDPLFHAGCYYVQEASSMILEHFVRTYFPNPAKVLDLCAAPGGKSTHLLALLTDESLLVANEVIRSRANILVENLIKWGNPNTFVTQNDPMEIGKSLHGFFDVIVADLPCTGEGMFRKDPAALAEWSVNNVRLCAERQRRIVADVWQALKPGGIFIYSTCTYNREENEENIEWICSEFDAELPEEPRRLMPHKTKGEGFFIAGIRKLDNRQKMIDNRQKTIDRRQKTEDKRSCNLDFSLFSHYLSSPENFIFISDDSSSPVTRHLSLVTCHPSPVTRHLSPVTRHSSPVTRHSSPFAIPAIHYSDYLQIKNSLRVLSAGAPLGEMKGRDLIPAHGLSMSSALSGSAFPRWEVDRETAINYLRREVLQNIPPEIPKGYVLITFKERPLGFVKNIETRANNLYPQEWRIRKL